VNHSGDDGGRAKPDGFEDGLGRASLAGRARRRALLAAFAAVVAFVGLAVPGSGCLNPRPEELPSSGPSGVDDDVAAPVRETCDDNPLLAGCDLPETDIEENTLTPEPTAPPPSLGSAPDSEEDTAPSPGAAGAGAGDAGSDDTPADAGTP
jgi:hypothetical protein